MLEAVAGNIQIHDLLQCDLTLQQYATLTKLPDDDLAKYQGVLGHFHVQTNKTDPGRACD